MKTNEQLMKACQIGCNNLNDANNLLAECYGRIGKIAEENERLRKDAERYQWLRDYSSTSHFLCRMFVTRYIGGATIPVYQGTALDASIDAARGAK